MTTPLSEKEIKKQILILEFYEAFDKDAFTSYIYETLRERGLAGGMLENSSKGRDFILTLFYGTQESHVKEVLQMNVFDVFGEARHKNTIKHCLHTYFIRIFGSDYKEVQREYEIFKKRKNIQEYKDGNDLLLQPWA